MLPVFFQVMYTVSVARRRQQQLPELGPGFSIGIVPSRRSSQFFQTAKRHDCINGVVLKSWHSKSVSNEETALRADLKEFGEGRHESLGSRVGRYGCDTSSSIVPVSYQGIL